MISMSGKSLLEFVGDRKSRYLASGEVNRQVKDAKAALRALHGRYATDGLAIDETDGYSLEFLERHFNIQMSNTEPAIRLIVESRIDEKLMQAKTLETSTLLDELS